MQALSPDATELYVSEFSSHLPAGALDAAPILCPQQQQDPPGQDVSSEVLHEPMELEDDDAFLGEDADEDDESWKIVTDPSGAYFLVGPHYTAQIDSNVVDNILNGYISGQEVLEIAMQSVVPSTSQAGPSGLSNTEKAAAAMVPSIAHIEIVDSGGESESMQPDRSDPQTPWLYNGRYLDENGGVELYDETEDQAYFAGKDACRDIEPVVVSDEEMEWYQDD
ncbi:hypothetical protein FRC11_001436 [Ceratobasidium sp. 423]|nr:hypothetical protein FRC11_001436 [Ceratobasidium sp. 423]